MSYDYDKIRAEREEEKKLRDEQFKRNVHYGVGVAAALGTVAFLWLRYKIALPNEMLVKTGFGVPGGLSFSRNAYQFPFQEIHRINMTPQSVVVSVNSRTNEYLNFKLPTVYVFGPVSYEDDKAGFKEYAKLLFSKKPEEIVELFTNIADGETRVHASQLSAKQINSEPEAFREKIIASVQQKLISFGIKLYTANVQNFQDADSNNKYWTFLEKECI